LTTIRFCSTAACPCSRGCSRDCANTPPYFDFIWSFRLNARPMLRGASSPFRELSRLVTQSLSGRLLLLTLLYVLYTEILLSLPSGGRYHRQLLDDHIQSAELAILPFTEPGGDTLSASLRNQLLKRAGAAAVLLKRADQKQFFLVEDQPPKWID